jgi:hypothetical protein
MFHLYVALRLSFIPSVGFLNSTQQWNVPLFFLPLTLLWNVSLTFFEVLLSVEILMQPGPGFPESKDSALDEQA